MNDLPPVETTLTDCHGRDHLYEITPFSYDEGFDLGMELADLIGGPLGDALKSMLEGGDFDLDDVDEGTLGQGLAELTTLPRRILAKGGSQLVARMLRGCVRADKDEQGELYKQHLKDPAARTRAFAAGNQKESFEALREVLQVNYGPFLERLFGSVSPYLSGLGASLKSFGQRSPGSPQKTGPGSEPMSTKQSKGGTE